MLKKQQTLLQHVIGGSTIYGALREMGVPIKTYEKWRQRHPQFKAALDSARSSQLQMGEAWTGGFAKFRKAFFGFDSPPFHLEMVNRYESAPGGSVNMILLPPNHGKTTLLADWICYILALDPNHRFLVLSESEGHAKKIIGRVKRRMTDPMVSPEYAARFGPFYVDKQEKDGKPWTELYITVAKATHDEQDYSLEAKGYNSQIYGGRFDTIFMDDCQSVKSLNMTEKIMDVLQQDVITRPHPETGKIFIIGTRVGQRDFYVTCQEQDVISPKCLMVKPALRFDGKQPLWPERFTVESLADMRRKVGEKAWWRAYMMRPQDDGTATFAERDLQNCKDDQLIISGKRWDTSRSCVAGLDPALDGGCALIVCEWDDRLRLQDLEKRFNVANNEAIYAFIEEYHNRYQFSDLIMEAVAFQKGLARDQRLREMADRAGFRIHEHDTNVNKISQSYGVMAMAGAFQRREIVLPWGDEKTAQRLERLIAELLAWRADILTKYLEQDLVMALWFIWKWWLQRRRIETQDTSAMFKAQGLPFEPLAVYDPERTRRGYLAERY
jgi:hypothetical protein